METKSKLTLKAFQKQIHVHGQCRCGVYLSGSTFLSAIQLDSVNSLMVPNVHFTVNCPQCNRIINLVDVSRKPLKEK
jgi:hypothetical protein